MDRLSAERRSANMRQIRSKDTSPEVALRRLLYGMGYRYRLHRKDLPGTPDIAFPSRRKVIFVHGCFWHQHAACREGKMPASKQSYWGPKLQSNVERDRKHQAELTRLGWETLVVWECQLKDSGAVVDQVKRFLGKTEAGSKK
ncbi:DNA mismatch endonuclease Vsr [Alloacidobacterium dinghuense]|uniref:Very short patch repair endonuclease n=1 Tax=Alloacidobacterium dinghuense TaxID=2763107 RepID=A0A7G8BE60_9BACT|nr:very short patch repair endonuclease [Alloacidobacterium dinghuense]QNI30830.1 DNA mismatch endonuclease Vsr [Alloacidobacterium dinghuense]